MTARRLLTLPNGKGHGWRPDVPDPVNDRKLSTLLGPLPRGTPENPSLDPQFFPRIRDQGPLGSCTGHLLRNCMMPHLIEKLGDKLAGEWGKKWDLSPGAAYWLGRQAINTIKEDSGAVIRDVVVAGRRYGIPTEASYPYDIETFTRRPSRDAFKTGRWHQVSPASYRCDEDNNRERTIDRILQALAAGMTIGFGFSVYSNIGESDANGIIPAPAGAMDGGHAVTGYWADTGARLLWGPGSWGNKIAARAPEGARFRERGYYGYPFQLFLDGLADDVWAIKLEEVAA